MTDNFRDEISRVFLESGMPYETVQVKFDCDDVPKYIEWFKELQIKSKENPLPLN